MDMEFRKADLAEKENQENRQEVYEAQSPKNGCPKALGSIRLGSEGPRRDCLKKIEEEYNLEMNLIQLKQNLVLN
jgi:hypothetical protein